MLSTVEYHIVGLTRHVPHNGQLADPTNKYAQAMKDITSKRKKTAKDYEDLENLEWEGSLYLNNALRVVVPGSSIIGALAEAGKKSSKGALIRSSILSVGEWVLGYDGPKDLAKLKADPNFRYRVGVKMKTGNRVMRTRPVFNVWSLTFRVLCRTDIINAKDLDNILATLGSDVGLSDDRKLMGGRFEVKSRKDIHGND